MASDDLGGDLHAGKRRILLIVGGNFALFVVMIGLPWLRGYLRTRALWHAFGAFGACLFGGTVAPEPGLGVPIGYESHFATRALAKPSWYNDCNDELARLAPDDATFLMPSVKVAENDLRAAVELVHNELAPLSAHAPGTRLSSRPLRAIERLRAGLANHTSATGAVAVPERDAFLLSKTSPVLPTPTRLPLYAGANALVSLWGSDVELTALATDQTGISYVHVQGGQLEQTRTPRPKLLEAAIPRSEPTSFVWAMPQARCAERAAGCADKALGVANVPLPVTEVPPPRWLGAHPTGRIDRSLWRNDERVVIAALNSAPGAPLDTQVREFSLDRDAALSTSADMPPLAPARRWSAGGSGDPLILTLDAQPVVLLARSGEHKAELVRLTAEAQQPLMELAGEGKAWLTGCTDQAALQLAFGHEHALVISTLAPDGSSRRFEPVAVELHDVISERDAGRDRVVPLCGLTKHTSVVVHDRRDRLLLVSCRAELSRCSVQALAASVRSFAVLARGERLILAYAGEGDNSQVRVRSIAVDAPQNAEERVPAVCWSDFKGLCGAPVLARVGERAILGAREGTDLRVLESADEGQTWLPLKGLGKRD
ncbi:MAG: hypothetical protein JWN04_5908 [Myxococcaceae bacterium]|nr:hypothetical protein [Myxococcaceae bacterium]